MKESLKTTVSKAVELYIQKITILICSINNFTVFFITIIYIGYFFCDKKVSVGW